MKSITYWHPFLYELMIRLSFKSSYRKRYESIRNLIEDNSSVTDVCCGDCKIVTFLKDKNIDYTGLDINAGFIRSAIRSGIKASTFEINKNEIPKADYILMMGSLGQFIPNHSEMIKKMLRAANRYVIISEPIRNYTHSRSKVVSFLATMLSDPGDGPKPHRFNLETLKNAMAPFRENIVKEFFAADGIEYVFVIKKGK